MNILILCTGNSCRSQMAHGFLQSFAPNNWNIASAGTEASGKVNERAIEAMQEVGIDISSHTSDDVNEYMDDQWDYVITVCDGAKETCPNFKGEVKHKLHLGFHDPSETEGTEQAIKADFVSVRDQIKETFLELYNSIKEDDKPR